MVIYDNLKYETLRGNSFKKMIYCEGLFLVCSKSKGIYGQIGEIIITNRLYLSAESFALFFCICASFVLDCLALSA